MGDRSPPVALSVRESEILRLVSDGLSNREIAERLILSLDTIKWHNTQIFNKLAVNTRTEATARARALGVLAADHASPQTSASITRIPHNLPTQITPFVGRLHEVREAQRLLNTARLLTITGPGGIGKTRLAVEVGANVLSDFVDGVYFVPCAAVSTVESVLWAIAESLDFQFRKSGEARDQLLGYFEDKHILLILDNFEHLVEQGDHLTTILKHAVNLKMLVTSRERLCLYGEVVLTLRGLTLPASDRAADLVKAESVQLFMQRAQATGSGQPERSEMRHIAQVCRLVEGMPLGIELAASWGDTLTAVEIGQEIQRSLDILAVELRDVIPGQHSIRAVFDRSWMLLTEQEQMSCRKLSVFLGGFTREAAAGITGVSLQTLQALVRKSLLRHDPQTRRYSQHELLRRYAAEKLADAGEASAVQHAHAVYFADRMADGWQRMRGSDQREAHEEIEADLDNVRAAWHYVIQQQAVDQIVKFLNVFWIVYDIKGWYPAAVELFQQGVAVMEAVATPEAHAALGWLKTVQGMYQVVNGYERDGFVRARAGFVNAQGGIDLLRAHGRSPMLIVPYISLAITACHFNATGLALRAAQECLDVAVAIQDDWAAAKAQQFLAMMALDQGRCDEARRYALQALNTFETMGDRWSKSILCIEVLGLLGTVERDFESARHWVQLGLETAEAVDFAYARQMAYWQFGYLEVLQGNYDAVARYWNLAKHTGGRIFGWKSVLGYGGSSHVGEWGGRKLLTG